MAKEKLMFELPIEERFMAIIANSGKAIKITAIERSQPRFINGESIVKGIVGEALVTLRAAQLQGDIIPILQKCAY